MDELREQVRKRSDNAKAQLRRELIAAGYDEQQIEAAIMAEWGEKPLASLPKVEGKRKAINENLNPE